MVDRTWPMQSGLSLPCFQVYISQPRFLYSFDLSSMVILIEKEIAEMN